MLRRKASEESPIEEIVDQQIEKQEKFQNQLEFHLSDEQHEVLFKLTKNMKNCSWKLFFNAAANLSIAYMQFSQSSSSEIVTHFANFSRSIILAWVVFVGTPVFNRLLGQKGDDIQIILNGIEQMKHVFAELAIMSTAIAVIQFSSAAVKWPFSTLIVSFLSLLVMITRLLVWKSPAIKQVWKKFTKKVFQPSGEKGVAVKDNYEFSHDQEAIILNLVSSMMASGYGLMLAFLSDVLWVFVNLVISPAFAFGAIFSIIDDAIMGVLIVRATKRFKLIVDTSDRDVSLFLEGLGQKYGIGGLFEKLGKVAFGIGLGKFAEIAFTMIKAKF